MRETLPLDDEASPAPADLLEPQPELLAAASVGWLHDESEVPAPVADESVNAPAVAATDWTAVEEAQPDDRTLITPPETMFAALRTPRSAQRFPSSSHADGTLPARDRALMGVSRETTAAARELAPDEHEGALADADITNLGTLSAAPVPLDQDAAPRRRRDWTPVLWGGAGFVAGALVWHVVGFWSFVSSVVLNGDDPSARTLESFLPPLVTGEQSAKLTTLGKPAARLAAVETQLACVALVSDRTVDGTRLSHCRGGTAGMRDAGFNRRTDKLVLKPRLQDPVAWTGTTAVQINAAQETPEANSSTEAPSTGALVETSAAADDTANIETGSLPETDLKLDLEQTDLTVPAR